MANRNETFFYKADNEAFTWKDVLSNVFKKHSGQELAEVFSAGLANDDVTRGELRSQWQKPWLFSRMLIYGIAAWTLVFIGLKYCSYLDSLNNILLGAAFIIPACVVPLSVALFFWEMNIPRNIPIYSVLAYIVFGGLLSAIVFPVFNFLFGSISDLGIIIGVVEEATKLVIVSLCLSRIDKCWGLNGLVVGAAVGCGVAMFETNGYGLNTLFMDGALDAAMSTLRLRGLVAITGHVAYTAMYSGALALAKGGGKLNRNCFLNAPFLLTFAAAIVFHGLWDGDLSLLLGMLGSFGRTIDFVLYDGTYLIGVTVLFTVAEYAVIIRVMKSCIKQIIKYTPENGIETTIMKNAKKNKKAIRPAPQSEAAVSAAQAQIQVVCLSGELEGCSFTVGCGDTVTLGRDPASTIRYSAGAKGVSGSHCSISFDGESAVVTDLGSTYGTFFPDGRKMQPDMKNYLKPGDRFYVGGGMNMFVIS